MDTQEIVPPTPPTPKSPEEIEREMAATREYLTSATNGDFQDIGEARFIWSAEVQPTGIENLDALVVTVERESRNSPIQASASGLIYNAPIDTGGGTTGGTP